jgi:hypothetical protein
MLFFYIQLKKNETAVGPTPISNEDRFLQNLKFIFDVAAVNISMLVRKDELLGFLVDQRSSRN